VHGRLLHLLVEDKRDKERRSAVPEGGREYRNACVVLEGEKAAQEGKERERERERVNT
jgi:hypothetical protein